MAYTRFRLQWADNADQHADAAFLNHIEGGVEDAAATADAAIAGAGAIPASAFEAAGDLLRGTGAGTYARLASGTAKQILRPLAGGGLEWADDIVFTKTVTAAAYTLIADDISIELNLTAADPVVTVPPSNLVALPIGTIIGIYQAGTGTATVQGDAGVTVEALGGVKTSGGQHSTMSLMKIATDTWVLSGAGGGGGGGANLIWNVVYTIAASTASQRQKDAADYVATGIDDHVTLQAAHDALPASGGKILVIGGTLNLGAAAVNWTKPGVLVMARNARIRKTTANWAIRFDGTVGTYANLTADAAKGATTISVATTGLAVGDHINIKSDATPAGATNPDGRLGERNQVKAIGTGTIDLAWPTQDAYTTLNTGRVAKINDLVEPQVIGGGFIQDGPITTLGIGQLKFKWCLRPYVQDALHLRNEQTAIEFENCMRAAADRVSMSDFTVNYPGQHYGYGIIDRGCSMWTSVTGLHAVRTGAAFGNGSGGDGIPRFATVNGGVAVETGAGTAAWSTHPECVGTTFNDCEAWYTLSDGFQLRGKGDRVYHPKVRDAGAIGIYVRDISRNCEVHDPDVVGTASHGIAVGGPTAEQTDALIIGGSVRDTTGHGVNVNVLGVSRAKNVVVRNPNRNDTFKIGFRNVAGDSIYETPTTHDAAGGSGYALYRDAGAPQFWDPRQTNVGGALIDGASWQYIRGEAQHITQPVVASAATITPRGPWTAVTGTVNITSITATYPGAIITLKFSAALTVTDGGNLFLAGNFVTAANATLQLGCDGANWYEIGRSTN